MTTLDHWIADHSVPYANPDAALAVRLMEELRAVERLVRERDPLGALRVIGSHPMSYVIHGDRKREVRFDLPVVELSMPKLGLRLCAADHCLIGWGISVESEVPVSGLDVTDMDFYNLTSTWFVGFEAAKAPVHGPYGRDCRRFSFHFRKLEGLAVAIERLIACR